MVLQTCFPELSQGYYCKHKFTFLSSQRFFQFKDSVFSQNKMMSPDNANWFVFLKLRNGNTYVASYTSLSAQSNLRFRIYLRNSTLIFPMKSSLGIFLDYSDLGKLLGSPVLPLPGCAAQGLLWPPAEGATWRERTIWLWSTVRSVPVLKQLCHGFRRNSHASRLPDTQIYLYSKLSAQRWHASSSRVWVHDPWAREAHTAHVPRLLRVQERVKHSPMHLGGSDHLASLHVTDGEPWSS